MQFRRSHRLFPDFVTEGISKVLFVKAESVLPFGYDRTDLAAFTNMAFQIEPMGIMGTFMLPGAPVIKMIGLPQTATEAEVCSAHFRHVLYVFVTRKGGYTRMVQPSTPGVHACYLPLPFIFRV
jgi:hypothetical protein